MPKAAWGWWRTAVPARVEATWRRACKEALWEKDTFAAAHLRRMTHGHWTDLSFKSGLQALQNYRLLAWQGGAPRRTTLWAKRVDAFLRKYGWDRTGADAWHHDDVGNLRFADGPAAKGKQDHLLREAFRRTCFNEFKESGRRDTFGDDLAYDEKRIEKVRKMHYRGPSGHHRNVLMGGGISDKMTDVIRIAKGQVPKYDQGCLRCGCSEAPGWEHLAWHCPGVQVENPPVKPQDHVQARLGWPRLEDGEYDDRVLHHLASVRKFLAETRRAEGYE
jgi:hypothetical protein